MIKRGETTTFMGDCKPVKAELDQITPLPHQHHNLLEPHQCHKSRRVGCTCVPTEALSGPSIR